MTNEFDYLEGINKSAPSFYLIRNGDNRVEDVKNFLKQTKLSDYLSNKKEKKNISSYYQEKLKNHINNFQNIIDMIDGDITFIYEPIYVDKLYRDTYYHYHSEKHCHIERNCKRIFILKDRWEPINLYDISRHDEIQKNLVGCVVIRPMMSSPIGRVLIDPFKTNIKSCYIRTTKLSVILLGQKYEINCYPFAAQDNEYMRCAETSLWTILEYCGFRYSEYRTILPNEFIKELEPISVERVLPSKGLDISKKSLLLKKFGFYPRVYTYDTYKKYFMSGHTVFKNIFYSYVQSGFPISMTITSKKLQKHAVVCIGHGEINYDKNINDTKKLIFKDAREIEFINFSELIDQYVIMDDNQTPYRLENYNRFSIDHCAQIVMFIVPLYKKIFMDVKTAYVIFETYIEDYIKEISSYVREHAVDKNNYKVIQNIFLTSSRNYHIFKVEKSKSYTEKYLYSSLPLPRFIWIMELGIYNDVKDSHKVFAEVVLDATVEVPNFEYNTLNNNGCMILHRIGKHIGYTVFNEDYSQMSKRFVANTEDIFEDSFEMFDKNLEFKM